MSKKTPITVAYGDGIGPEIMQATLKILEAAGAELDIETIDIGEKVYLAGNSAGIPDDAWSSLERTRVFLKAPITTPQGGGYKSLNVTVRKTLGLFANVRPCNSYFPYVATKYPELDLKIIRENEEDLYGGIEHRQTDEVYQCLKLITRPGTERIMRFAFEYARSYGRKRVSCFTKDNIMKMTDGLFHKIFDEVGADYPDIEKEHLIIDIGTAKLASSPERFDVLVLPNLYGDILSDVAAEIAGSVGMCGSANVGNETAMFEAIHGSAPDIAGKNIANPSGLLHGAILMLVHINQVEVAGRIHNAWLSTIEQGVHTAEIVQVGITKEKVGTKEFADAVIERLGETPTNLKAVHYEARPSRYQEVSKQPAAPHEKKLVGVDVFIHERDRNAETLAKRLNDGAKGAALNLELITNRGVKVWPEGHRETFCTDHWRCRFIAEASAEPDEVWALLRQLSSNSLDIIKIENLYTFDGKRGYSLGQGQ